MRSIISASICLDSNSGAASVEVCEPMYTMLESLAAVTANSETTGLAIRAVSAAVTSAENAVKQQSTVSSMLSSVFENMRKDHDNA